MTSCKGSSGAVYVPVGAALARGGEGTLFQLLGEQDKVVKILHPPHRTEERHRKLSAMVAAHSTSATRQCAWPTDVLYVGNKFVGYVMPRVNGCGLREVYAYGGKRGTRPWRYFITVARNLASAVGNFHEVGQVVGDLNPDNVLVNPTSGLVTLVDTDSYHVRDSAGHVYRCSVGKSDFVAPELQGIHFPTAPLPTFTRETDRFSLALMIFMILMNGAHPYACRPGQGVSGSLLQPIENIKKGISPYFGVTHVRGIDIPAYAPAKEVLSPQVQELFERAFATGHNNPRARPSGEEWHEALGELAAHLSTCRVNRAHQFHSSRRKCRWCEVDETMAGLTGKPASSAPVAVVPLAPPSPRAVGTVAGVAASNSPIKSPVASRKASSPRTSVPSSAVYSGPMKRSLSRWWRAVRMALSAAVVGAVLAGLLVLGNGTLGSLGWEGDNSTTADAVATDAEAVTVSLSANRVFAVDEEWVYFDNGSISRIRTNGTEASVISDHAPDEVVVCDGWLYYTYTDGAHGHDGLYRVRTDGSGAAFLGLDSVHNMRAVGSWMYYTGAEAGPLFKVRVDGSEGTKLSTGEAVGGSLWSSDSSVWDYEVDTENGRIYFLNSTPVRTSLYWMSTDGSTPELLLKDVHSICMDSESLCTLNYGGNQLGRIRLQDLSYTSIDVSANLGLDSTLLYIKDGFCFVDEGGEVERVDLVTGNVAAAVGHGVGDSATGDGWLYYEDDHVLRKMRLDGTDDQPIVPQ